MEHRAEKGTLYYDEYETKDHTVSQCKTLWLGQWFVFTLIRLEIIDGFLCSLLPLCGFLGLSNRAQILPI